MRVVGRLMIGLVVLAGGALVSAPADAMVWKNYKNESQCLGVAGANMNQGTGLVIWDCAPTHTDQSWSTVLNIDGTAFSTQMYDNAAPDHSQASSRCAALPAGNISNGIQLIIWNCPASTTDQYWHFSYIGPDAAGNRCYSILNKEAYDAGFGRVISVSSGNMSRGTAVVLRDVAQTGLTLDQIWCEY